MKNTPMASQVMLVETQKVETLPPEVQKIEVIDVTFARFLRANPDTPKEDRLKLGRYLKSVENGNHKKVTYKLGKSMRTSNLPLGRLCADGLSLQTFPRDLRNALAARYYWDVDIINAQPTLMVQYCTRQGWDCRVLRRYVETREEILEEVQTSLNIERWEAKERILAVLFGGSPEGLPSFIVRDLVPEIRRIMTNIWSTHTEVLKWLKNQPNHMGKGMAYIFQTEERKVLLAMDRAFAARGRSMDVLIHDGGLVRKRDGEPELPSRILREIEADIKTETQYDVRLLVKPLDTTYEHQDDEEHPLTPPDVVIDDAYAARHFCERMGDSLVLDTGDIWIFNEETGMWGCDKASLERVITRMNGMLVFRQMGVAGVRTFDYSGSVDKRSALIRMLPSVATARDGFMRQRLHSDIGKLLFTDGIYDFASGIFTKGFDPNIVFTARMPRAFPERTPDTDQRIAVIRDTTFRLPFNGTGDERTLLHELMRAAVGDFTRKKAVVGLGPPDCSKGLTTALITTAFGSYAQSYNGNSLLHKGHATESERDNTFILKFCASRFAFSSEIKIPLDSKHQVAIDGNLFKTLVSGGDEIQARRLHENARSIVNKAQLFIFANDMPRISPSTNDVSSKIVPVNWSIQFVDSPTGPGELKKDPTLSARYKTAEYGDAMVWLLIDEYNAWKSTGFREIELPETARLGLEELVPAKRLGTLLLEHYEITKSPLDSVSCEELYAFAKEEGWEGTENRLGRELTAFGLGVGKRRDGRRTIKLRTGIRPRLGV